MARMARGPGHRYIRETGDTGKYAPAALPGSRL
jgi:hypothetical protein